MQSFAIKVLSACTAQSAQSKEVTSLILPLGASFLPPITPSTPFPRPLFLLLSPSLPVQFPHVFHPHAIHMATGSAAADGGRPTPTSFHWTFYSLQGCGLGCRTGSAKIKLLVRGRPCVLQASEGSETQALPSFEEQICNGDWLCPSNLHSFLCTEIDGLPNRPTPVSSQNPTSWDAWPMPQSPQAEGWPGNLNFQGKNHLR